MSAKTTWFSDINVPPANPTLQGNVSGDVCIVGGGLAGTLSAYLLGKAGKRVMVLEKKDISSSTTAYTTAWLNCVVDTDLSQLIKMYGEAGAKKIWNSGIDAIDLIEKIVAEEKIDCEFKRVSHFRYGQNKKEIKNLLEEHKSAEKLGFETVFVNKKTFNFKSSGSLEIKSQAKFHPIKFLIGLRQACLKYGVVFYDNTEALNLQSKGCNVIINTKKGNVEANYSIITTYKPFNKPKELFAHLGMYVSYVFEIEIPKGILTAGLYEDEKNPYHYFRVDEFGNYDRIIIGGEDHRKEIPISLDKNYKALEKYFSELLPKVHYKINNRWNGQILETLDGLPYIGRYSKENPNKMIATGFSGNGMTYSAVAAQIFFDIIFKKENPYIQLYHAGRKTKLLNFLRKLVDFGGEFFGGLVKNMF